MQENHIQPHSDSGNAQPSSASFANLRYVGNQLALLALKAPTELGLTFWLADRGFPDQNPVHESQIVKFNPIHITPNKECVWFRS